MVAKALVSTIHSEYADIDEIRSQLSVLENVVNVLESEAPRNGTFISENAGEARESGQYTHSSRSRHSEGSSYSSMGSSGASRYTSPSARSVSEGFTAAPRSGDSHNSDVRRSGR